jgi:glycosyltransferase involved in cell wall biosynthesis
MRTAHIITRLILGGAQENTILNCQDLIHDHGDEVLLITGPGIGPEGSLEADATARGIPLHIIPSMRRAIHPTRDVSSYREIVRALEHFRPDVVHTHSGKAGLLGRLAAWRHGVPAIVHTVHGAPFHAYQSAGARAFFRRCEVFASRRCHAIISVADAMIDQLVAAGVAPREKFTTIYSSMEVEPFLNAAEHRDRVRRELGYSDDDVVVGKVARLFHLKGHADLIASARQACCHNPRLRFLLVGDGALRQQIEAQIAAAGLAERFQFTGLVPPSRIPELLAATDLVVHASYREGLARVLPQALLTGRPVVSYDIDGARADQTTRRLVAAPRRIGERRPRAVPHALRPPRNDPPDPRPLRATSRLTPHFQTLQFTGKMIAVRKVTTKARRTRRNQKNCRMFFSVTFVPPW